MYDVPPSRAAATAVLIRDSNSYPEVLMLKRSGHGTFGNLWVFPGGSIDNQDYAAVDGEFEAAKIAAMRETLEETNITLEPADLQAISHWTPPKEIPTRFLTWFFIVQVDPGLAVSVDDHEIVGHQWVKATNAIEAHRKGEMAMAPPTVVTLTEIAEHRNCGSIKAFYRERGIFRYRPKFARMAKGHAISLYSEDSGYDSGDPDTPGSRHRLVIQQGICTYEKPNIIDH